MTQVLRRAELIAALENAAYEIGMLDEREQQEGVSLKEEKEDADLAVKKARKELLDFMSTRNL